MSAEETVEAVEEAVEETEEIEEVEMSVLDALKEVSSLFVSKRYVVNQIVSISHTLASLLSTVRCLKRHSSTMV